MKTLLIAAAAIAALTAPAYALTALEVQQALGGYHCAGSTCTLKINGTDHRHLPPIYPANASRGPEQTDTAACGIGFFEPVAASLGICNINISAAFMSSPGTPDSGFANVAVCTTKTATLGFSNGSFSLAISSHKSDGHC